MFQRSLDLQNLFDQIGAEKLQNPLFKMIWFHKQR